MNPSSSRRAVIAAGFVLAASAATAAPAYHLVDLGLDTSASAINDHGVVAGSTRNGAAVYRDGAWHGKPAGREAYAIDDALDLGGYAIDADYREQGLYWPAGGSAVALGLPAGESNLAITGVATGQAVGYSTLADGTSRCVYWSEATGTIALDIGSGDCYLAGINAAGQMVGRALQDGAAYPTAFIRQDGVVTNLGTLGGAYSSAAAINAKGHVAVTAWLADQGGNVIQHVALYDGRKLVDLGGGLGEVAEAFGMNDHDDIVGRFYAADRSAHPFVCIDGVMTALDSIVDFGAMKSIQANAIDNAGVIVGTGFLDRRTHAFMLVPDAR